MDICPQHTPNWSAALLAACAVALYPFAASAQQNPGAAKAPALSREQMMAAITVREPDAFYNAPSNVPNQPGVLLRSELLKDVTLATGMQGWRILYTTTVDDQTPATAVTTVFAPVDLPAGPRPIIDWVHGTTGLVQKCMPSLVSAPTFGIPAQAQAIKAGWVIVATDYSFAERGGPHPYIIGEGEARAGLDAVRAAHQMTELTLDARTVVWGHSQGGHSALWTGIVGPRYAPELNIVGVAAIAPAANPARIIVMNPAIDKGLGPYIAASYSRFYPDIKFEMALRPEALAAGREITKLCGSFPPDDPKRIRQLTATFEAPTLATKTNPALAARLAQNTADRPIAAPLLIAQGLADAVVSPMATEMYVEERCAAGQNLEYWTVAGRDHSDIVQPDSPLAVPLAAWTAARFDDQAPKKDCSRRSF
jgi:pimeloyl-ACP methyl ester carboxylesterase